MTDIFTLLAHYYKLQISMQLVMITSNRTSVGINANAENTFALFATIWLQVFYWGVIQSDLWGFGKEMVVKVLRTGAFWHWRHFTKEKCS